MYKNHKYLSRRTIEDRIANHSQANFSVILGMIVLVITLSIVTFSKNNENSNLYGYRYKTYVK